MEHGDSKKYPTDIAITNTGGIRTDLIGIKGYKITWGAAQAVQPFQNFLQHAQLTGAQIKQVLNEQFENGDRKLEVAGIYYTYNQQGIKEVYSQLTSKL
nr:5'-nucleotidase C-terminal domain-containing protein [Kurthia zopfii]